MTNKQLTAIAMRNSASTDAIALVSELRRVRALITPKMIQTIRHASVLLPDDRQALDAIADALESVS